MNVNSKHVYDVARDFQVGSRILAERFGQVVFPLRSTIVSAAFSVELYLKCLLLLTVGTVPKRHNLIDLYDALQTDVKNLAQAKYREVAPQSGQLRDVLAEHDGTFLEWRYVFEKQDKPLSLNWMSLCDAATALNEATLSLQPDWRQP